MAIAGVLGLAVVLFFIAFWYALFSPSDSDRTSSGGDKPTGDFSANSVQPQASLTAEEYAKAYAEDEASADNKFKGRRLALRGTAVSVSKNISGTPYITFAVRSGMTQQVHAYMRSPTGDIERVSPRQAVDVVCTGIGMTLVVAQANDCVLTGLSQLAPAVGITSEQDHQCTVLAAAGSMAVKTDLTPEGIKDLCTRCMAESNAAEASGRSSKATFDSCVDRYVK